MLQGTPVCVHTRQIDDTLFPSASHRQVSDYLLELLQRRGYALNRYALRSYAHTWPNSYGLGNDALDRHVSQIHGKGCPGGDRFC